MARGAQQAVTDVIRQRRRVRGIEAQAHGRGRLVDVLTAGSRTAEELFAEFGFGDGDLWSYVEHRVEG